MIKKERLLREFMEMVQIRCSTFQEREIADVLKAKLGAIGLDVTEDQAGEELGGTAGNVYGFWRGLSGAPRVLLSAHMDCVEPCGNVRPVLTDGVIRSSGDTILGGDDKAGVAPILEALRVIREKDLPHGDIQVIFTIAEEGGLNGSKHMKRERLKADMGFVLDGGGQPGTIITKAPGQNTVQVIVHGKTAHAGVAPEEGINAIVLAGKALAEVRSGRIDRETTANVGIIKGGQATNIVPDHVEIDCEVRSRDADKLEAETRHMCETFERIVTTSGGRVEIKVSREYDSFEHEDGAPVIRAAAKAAESIGLTPALAGTGGGSDANFFNRYSVPTVVLGVGMAKVHTKEEYLREEDLYKTAEWVVAIIEEAAKIRA